MQRANITTESLCIFTGLFQPFYLKTSGAEMRPTRRQEMDEARTKIRHRTSATNVHEDKSVARDQLGELEASDWLEAGKRTNHNEPRELR